MINGLMICSRGLNEFYCTGLWSDGRVVSLEVVIIFSILTPNPMLPHNDGFLLATATFIQHSQVNTHP